MNDEIYELYIRLLIYIPYAKTRDIPARYQKNGVRFHYDWTLKQFISQEVFYALFIESLTGKLFPAIIFTMQITSNQFLFYYD